MNPQIEQEERQDRLKKLESARKNYVYYGTIDEGSFAIDDIFNFRKLVLDFVDDKIQKEKQELHEIEISIGRAK